MTRLIMLSSFCALVSFMGGRTAGARAATQHTYRCPSFGLTYTIPAGWTAPPSLKNVCTAQVIYTQWYGYGDDNPGHEHGAVQIIAGRTGMLIPPGVATEDFLRRYLGSSSRSYVMRHILVTGVRVVVAESDISSAVALYAVARTTHSDVLLIGGVRRNGGPYTLAQATALRASIGSLRLTQ